MPSVVWDLGRKFLSGGDAKVVEGSVEPMCILFRNIRDSGCEIMT